MQHAANQKDPFFYDLKNGVQPVESSFYTVSDALETAQSDERKTGDKGGTFQDNSGAACLF